MTRMAFSHANKIAFTRAPHLIITKKKIIILLTEIIMVMGVRDR